MPPLPDKNGSRVSYGPVPLEACKSLVYEKHYSHRLPTVVKLCYAATVYSPGREVKACTIFSRPVGRWETANLWELTRLVRQPNFDVPLTRLISKAVGYIRSQRGTELLISFADVEEDHHGGIYQACSWLYDGLRGSRIDGFNIDGEFVTARQCNHVYGTSSVEELLRTLPDSVVVPHFDAGKHCYWKALSKTGMQLAISLGLGSAPYPKPLLTLDGEFSKTSKKGVVRLPTYRPLETQGYNKPLFLGESIVGGNGKSLTPENECEALGKEEDVGLGGDLFS